MNKNHILLSISMLISGRDEMEKCLNSLLYFKNAFPTEIILVDTGCNAEQRALAEKYADKIIDFIYISARWTRSSISWYPGVSRRKADSGSRSSSSSRYWSMICWTSLVASFVGKWR